MWERGFAIVDNSKQAELVKQSVLKTITLSLSFYKDTRQKTNVLEALLQESIIKTFVELEIPLYCSFCLKKKNEKANLCVKCQYSAFTQRAE